MGFIQDIVAKGYGGYRGWNNDAAAEADYKATGGQGKWDPGAGSPSSSSGSNAPASDPSALFQQALRMQQQAAEPVVSALGAQRAAVPGQFATSKTTLQSQTESLKTRYANILGEMGRRQSVDTAAVNRAESREYGRRGIPLSSGMFEQNLIEKQRPVSEFYAGQTKDISLESEDKLTQLANRINALPSEEQKQLADIDLAIAMAKSGNSQKAVEILMSMGASQQQAAQFAAQQSRSSSEFEKTFGESQRQFNVQETRLNKPAVSATATKTAADTTAKNEVLSRAKSGWTLADLQRVFGAQLGTEEVVRLYSSVSPYGQPTEAYAQKILGTYNPKSSEIDPITGLPKQSLNRLSLGQA